jgi:mediator of RNA polymerase II transcription subunit 16
LGLIDKFSAAVAALTLAFSRGCGGESNTDDVLMVALRQLSPGECTGPDKYRISIMLMTFEEAQTTFISEVYRALPVNCNFTAEQDKLMSHPYIPRCLSLQAGLGFKGRSRHRNLASAVPWAILQLRHASVLFAYFFQYNKGGQTESHDPGELNKAALLFSLSLIEK